MQTAKTAPPRTASETAPPAAIAQRPATPARAPTAQRRTPNGLDTPTGLGHRFETTDVYPRSASDGLSSQSSAPAGNTVVQRKAGKAEGSRGQNNATDTKENGQPLPDPLREKMERALGADFSGVRVHESPEAAAIGALAYARGSHLHFAPGGYRPHTPAGQRVIGHELVHVVQQRQQRLQPTGHIKGLPVYDNPAHETEADILGQAAAQGNAPYQPNNVEAGESVPSTAASPIQAIWRNKLTGETSTEPPKRQTRGWEWVPDKVDDTDSHPRGMKRTRDESDDEGASNDSMELDDSSESGEEDSSDGDFTLGGASKRQAIDPRTVPEKLTHKVDPKTSAKETTWSNKLGVQAHAVQQGSVTKTTLSGMRALPPGMTAKRTALEGKVKLHSAKKGAGGGRKHNPDDTHSTHTAGTAKHGVPSQPGLGTGHDASAKYNQKYYPHENKLRGLKGHTFQSVSEVETEPLDDPERIKAIMKLKGLHPKVTKARVVKRASVMKEQNRATNAIKNAKIEYTSDRGEKVSSGELGRDVYKGVKDKWLGSDYDPEDSSSDEDIRQGTNAKKRGRDSDEPDIDQPSRRKKPRK